MKTFTKNGKEKTEETLQYSMYRIQYLTGRKCSRIDIYREKSRVWLSHIRSSVSACIYKPVLFFNSDKKSGGWDLAE